MLNVCVIFMIFIRHICLNCSLTIRLIPMHRYLQQNYSGHHQSNSTVTGVGTTHGAPGGAKTYRMDDGAVEQFYRSNNHSERIMRKMELYHNKQELCDVVLIAGQRRIPAHRIVLSAASDYFAAMFTSDCREANEKEVLLQNIDSEALNELIQYMYTGE